MESNLAAHSIITQDAAVASPSKARRSWSKYALALAFLVSLLFHFLTADVTWRALLHYAMLAELASPHATMPMIDLTETPNRIAPEHAQFVGKEHNATEHEAVAAHPRSSAAAGAPVQSSAQTTHEKKEHHRVASHEILPNPSTKILHPQHEMTEPNPARAQRKFPATAMVEGLNGTALGPPEDFFPNFKRGPHTYVNVMRYPGIDYFVEMKRTLRMTWNPGAALMRGLLPERHVVQVVVGVSVSARGTLDELFILRSSGLPAYDAEALRTFRASSPFFPPPAKILSLDGAADDHLHMSWGFICYF